MSSRNTITMVTPAPRPSVVLPNEILKMILMNILIFSSVSPRGRPINATRFAMLNKCMLHNISVVSRQFHVVALQIFYEENYFDFISTTSHRTPLMPPIHLLRFLRHIRVQLVLTDSYAGEPTVLPDRILDNRIYFRNTADLFKHCRSAHTLRTLSDLMTFQDLRTIQLHIVPIFSNPDSAAAVAIYDGGRFMIGARDECNITGEARIIGLRSAMVSGLWAHF